MSFPEESRSAPGKRSVQQSSRSEANAATEDVALEFAGRSTDGDPQEPTEHLSARPDVTLVMTDGLESRSE
jgi:hypothetical protein